jgi:superfamily II DNA or RNA helicase/HKD family nuclease
MSRPSRGLYQALLTEALKAGLSDLGPSLHAKFTDLHHSDVADRLAAHLARVIEKVIATIAQERRVSDGVQLTRQLILRAVEATKADFTSELPADPGQFLTAILGILPNGHPESLSEPMIPLLDTALLTNAPGEPRVGHQVVAEIPSADRIDFVMAFIRRSGIRPMLDALRRHCALGNPLRVLTTVYTGSTEADALEDLSQLGAEIRVSYDTSSTRLHAKAWLFHRNSGFSTAYIGSSNLTHSAQVSGLEWNVRVSAARNATVVDKVAAVFESYWNSDDFVPFNRGEFDERRTTRSGLTFLSPVELRAEPFQERLLEQIALSRLRGYHRNLLVSATGTGKTVMAAIDYARLREKLPRARLLFVAHRKEILSQALGTFRHAIRDHDFGEMWVGGTRPQLFDHVFASIQSLSASGLSSLDPAHFDVVVVDEFHHSESPTYRNLLEHVRPLELLGLTATPERADGQSLLHWFDERIAAELRLWDAIDQQKLAPFIYYGVADSLDFRQVPWQRGRGYDVEGLSNLLTADDAWARQVIKALYDHVDDVHSVRALGFCVSVDHARFMARVFNEHHILSKAIWSDTSAAERDAALRDLAAKRINVLFSVDIFNEGVDVPSVDTLLMLRPTDSPTLFLQQLGRGLRKYPEKRACTVIDFIGLHRREFRFDQRLGALLGGTRADLAKQVEEGFPFLPAGCHMEFSRVASDRVLQSIRSAVPDRWTRKVQELQLLAKGRRRVTLAEYLDATGLLLEDIYTGNRCWSDLLEDAGLDVLESGPIERDLRRACGRLLHVDDAVRIETYKLILSSMSAPIFEDASPLGQRFQRMLIAALVGQAAGAHASIQQATELVWKHPQVRAELLELMDLLAPRIQHVGVFLGDKPTLPLTAHARYTRIEIQAAFNDGSEVPVPTWREGVRFMAADQCDVFVFTLDKTSGQFSPTTRYRDFAISRELIHWESQSTTRTDSQTGRRYQTHIALGTGVMLFARLKNDDRAFYFLGPAEYVSHESEMPMAITWRLRFLLPGDLFANFAAAIA